MRQTPFMNMVERLRTITGLSETERLAMLEVAARWFDLHDRINRRARLVAQIEAHAVNGKVNVIAWSRDCDHSESTRCFKIAATPDAYWAAYGRMEDGAEGPFTLHIVSQDEADAFEPETRDFVLEAYENGNSYLVGTMYG